MNGGNSKKDGGTAYVISVAAELSGMHPQTLRQYDRLGLVTPLRTKGRGRRYTPADIDRLRRIQSLSQEEGVNLAGIRRIMALEEELRRLREHLAEARRQDAQPVRRVFAADSRGRINTRSPDMSKTSPSKRGTVALTRSHSQQMALQEPWHLQLPKHMQDLFALYLLGGRGPDSSRER